MSFLRGHHDGLAVCPVFGRGSLRGWKIGFVPTYGNTSWDWPGTTPLVPKTIIRLPTMLPSLAPVLRVINPESNLPVEYDTWGRVELTTLTKEFFMPRFLERDEALRRKPWSEAPWDGVAEVRPFGYHGKENRRRSLLT